MKTGALFKRRDAIEHQRSQFEDNNLSGVPESVSIEILSSWRRSADSVKSIPSYAPADDEYLTSNIWQESPLSIAAQREQGNMIQLVSEGQLVAAIADPCGRLLWTHASSHMRGKAENLNFVAGGHWNENAVGTNAVGLSLKLRQPVTVFSCEHYLPFVQDWVCYAAPIIHPITGECVGALDISTTWNKHTPLGQSATTQLANSIAGCLPEREVRAELEVHALGQPLVIYRGRQINLSPRHLEILCLLALNPEGLGLQRLHSALYGDTKVSTATLKADVSHLRNALNGEIGSRPYRLTMPVWADFTELWRVVNENRINEAMSIYRGAFLPHSESPEIEEWRYCLDAVMDRAVGTCENPDTLIAKLHKSTSGCTLVRERLLELLD